MPEKRLLWTRQSREGSSCPRDHHHASSVDDAILLPFMPAMHIDERVCLLEYRESSVACLSGMLERMPRHEQLCGAHSEKVQSHQPAYNNL